MIKRWIFIVFILATIHYPEAFSHEPAEKISVEDVVGTKFFPNLVEGIRSMNDGEHYTMLDDGQRIIRYSYATGLPTDTLFSTKWNKSVSYVSEYQLSADESKILITSDKEPIYRHSFMANYYVYNRKDKMLKLLSGNGKQQLASFSPTGDKVAFVRNNNLFLVDLQTWNEKQITTDGEHNKIINGAPDWVYEEEFEFTKGYEWSPDGKRIAFMRFDESRVRMYTITVYDSLYPTEETYKYPKAGEENSAVSVEVYNLETGKISVMDAGKNTDQYIPRIRWTRAPGKLCILRLNRFQDTLDVLLDDVTTGKSEVAYTDVNKKFISGINDQFITFLNDGKSFLVFSERDGFKHLYRYTLQGKLINQVTRGNFDVDELLGIDTQNNVVYYSSTEDSPIERQVYSIKLNGTDKYMLTDKKGVHHAEFSHNCKFFIDTWSDANTPPIVSVLKSDGKIIRVLEENNALKARVHDYGFTKMEFIKIPTTGQIQLNAYILKPADFDSTRKYPLFMYVYGGPDSQEVMDTWNYRGAWFQMLAQHGYIVVCVDNRGTDGRGEAFRKCTYMQLGKLETEDQLNAARYLGSLSYIDSTRIGIFGWSYGGYMASLCMLKGAGLFRMGIAVAPVTSWRFYDSIYTERYMRRPRDNEAGYDENSPLACADELTGKFLLIHGSADDNVHLQNTMEFAAKLIQADKKFDMAIYPNKNHGIYGGNTRLHLYTKMTDFILQNL